MSWKGTENCCHQQKHYRLCPQSAPAPAQSAPSPISEPCPAGSFGNGGNDCELCPTKTFSASAGSATCEDCPANSVARAGSTSCNECGEGLEPNRKGKVCIPSAAPTASASAPVASVSEESAPETTCTDKCMFLAADNNDCCPGNVCVWLPTGDECLPSGTCIKDRDECKFHERVGDSCCNGSTCIDKVGTSDVAPKASALVAPTPVAPAPEASAPASSAPETTCTDKCVFLAADNSDFCPCKVCGSQPEMSICKDGDECKFDERVEDSGCNGSTCVDEICTKG